MDLMGFAQLMERRATQLETNSLNNKKKITRTILKELAQRTPADVGTAISNWKVSLGAPIDFSNLAFTPGNFGNTKDANISATISAGESVIGSMRLGQLVYISNTVDYIEDLNDGASKQAPAGFVELAVQSGESLAQSLQPIVSV